MSSLQQTQSDHSAPRTTATIRQASPADLPAARQLLSLRDQREWDQAAAHWFLGGLHPENCLAWMAFDGAKPVGLSSRYVRTLRVNGVNHRAGYWANLYIHPEYRDLMLYPRLPMAMNQGLKGAGLRFLYANVRQRDVAETHLRIGFGRIGRMNVLFKPLRPGRLLAKHKNLGSAAIALAKPMDAMYAGARAALKPRGPRDLHVDVLQLQSPQIERIVQLLNSRAESFNDKGQKGITQQWTAASFIERFRQTREGGRYILLGVRRKTSLVGGVIFRIAERGGGIRAGVIMDAVVSPGDETCLIPALLEAERQIKLLDGDVMLYLDGQGPHLHKLMRRCGYRNSPETYDLLIWPKVMLNTDPVLADLSNWRFSFGDHDAF
jgi:hypothetical protein